jgi:hypothetical protein
MVNRRFGGIAMASAAQIQANRLNARKSTGPRTPAGKERASRNAFKHGLLAREAVIRGEDPEEFERYREGMIEALAPAGPVEAMLAERVVGLSWRLRRAERLQNAAFAALDGGEPTPLLDARLEEWKHLKGSEWERGVSGVVDENGTLGQVVVDDFADARVLDRLLMYERRIESSLYRTMAELRRERQRVCEKPVHRGMGVGSPAQDSALGGPFQPMNHRQDADATRPHGQDARATSHTRPQARATAAPPQDVLRSQSHLPPGQEPATPAELASFGANAAPEAVASGEEEVSSVKGRVSRAEGPVSGDGSGFAPQTSHFKPPKITPCGPRLREGRLTTNPKQSCETNPISGGVSRWP